MEEDGPPYVAPALAVLLAAPVAAAAQAAYTFSLRSGEIVRTTGYSAVDVLWCTVLRTRLSSRYFGGRPEEAGVEGGTLEAGFRGD